jgi:G3E family GTPase
MAGTGRAELVVVAGGITPATADGIERVIAHLLIPEARMVWTARTIRGKHPVPGPRQGWDPGVAVLHHDLSAVSQGVVRRRLRRGVVDETTVLELAHGCVSCTLREDVLPMLRALGRNPEVSRIVLHLDPVMEPEQVCNEILNTTIGGASVTDAVELRGVITVLDVGSWLEDATSSEDLAERGLAVLPDDERTISQLVVEQVEFADLIVYAGTAEGWLQARTGAVLARLTPLAPRLSVDELDSRLLLAQLPAAARRGRPESVHSPLLRGQPPLDPSAGVQLLVFTARRPFHPERLHDAIDALLDGVVRTRGRVWLATRPEAVLWLESAGGGLQIGHAGEWLVAGDARAWQDADPERHAQAALRWHARWGDRAQDLSNLVHEADPAEIETALRAALLTDDELAEGERAWAHYPDPFGWWHTDPCDDIAPEPMSNSIRSRSDQADQL